MPTMPTERTFRTPSTIKKRDTDRAKAKQMLDTAKANADAFVKAEHAHWADKSTSFGSRGAMLLRSAVVWRDAAERCAIAYGGLMGAATVENHAYYMRRLTEAYRYAERECPAKRLQA